MAYGILIICDKLDKHKYHDLRFFATLFTSNPPPRLHRKIGILGEPSLCPRRTLCTANEYPRTRAKRKRSLISQASRVVVTVGLEPTVSLRSVSFAIVALLRCRLHRSFAQPASASLHPALRALGSAPHDVNRFTSWDRWFGTKLRPIQKNRIAIKAVLFFVW